MTATLKAGDTVWTIDGEWIQNFDDDYYAIKIPTHVCQRTIKKYEERPCFGKLKQSVWLENGYELSNYEHRKEFYLTEDEALKALREERKQFLTSCPNNWQKIVEELQQLLKEQSND
jgi:hypothetical protein